MFEPTPIADAVRVHANGLTMSGYTFVVQAMLGISTIGIPVVDACAMCSRNVASDAPLSDRASLLIHAGSHSELLNNHTHKPIVTELIRFFKLHGFAACTGDYGGGHRHSADLTVMHYYDVGRHLRIDVKTCVEFNVSNGRRGFDEHLALMESRCTYEHRGSAVVCFAVTAPGGLGPAAIALLATLVLSNRGLGNSGVVEEMELSWLVPSHGKYRHRRPRGIAMEGWTNIVRACAGARFHGEVFALADDPTMELVYTSMAALEGSRDCPSCGQCRSDCSCCCAAIVEDRLLIGGGGSCGDRVNSRDSTWPLCVICLHCNSCCSC